MHKITMYESLRDKIDTEIENINAKGITNENLDHLYKLTMSLKAIDKHIYCLEEEMEGEEGYSGRKRNALGQYSRNYPRYPYSYDWNVTGRNRTYSRDNAKMKMINKLETLMDDTMSEHEREVIRNCINELNA